MPPTNNPNRHLGPRSARSASPAILATTLCIVILVPALLFLLLYLKSRKKPKAQKCKGRHVHWYGRCHGHGHRHGHYHGGGGEGRKRMAGRRRCHVKSHKKRGCRRTEEEVPATVVGEGVAMAGANGGMDMGGMGDMPPMMGDMGDMPPPPVVDGPVMDPGMMWGGLVPPGGERRGRGRRHCFGRH